MTDLDEILTGSRGVWAVDHGSQGVDIAVWHGGHTVNSYLIRPDGDGITLDPTGTASVGDYKTGETTREQAESAAMDLLTRPEEEP